MDPKIHIEHDRMDQEIHIDPFLKAMGGLIQERFLNIKNIYFTKHSVVALMEDGDFVLYCDYVYHGFSMSILNFDIANPKFDPEDIIKWMQKHMKRHRIKDFINKCLIWVKDIL